MSELSKILEQVGKDKGIDRNILVTALEEAMMTVARRKYGLSRDIEARFNDDTGQVELFELKTVVETIGDKNKEILLADAQELDPDVTLGDRVGIEMDTTLLSRIAAQTAKQVIVQKVRDAEREIIFNEFQHRKGEIITGLIRRVDRGAIIVDLGRTEGFMPQKEQIPGENYNPGDRIQAYLTDVQLTPKGPRIILSRACPEYLISLFQTEVPEIREGLVVIKGAAREPGIRAKIAVTSRDPDVDPIGACVGVRGSRVQTIVHELKGERIDIVPWDEDITRFTCNALAPAEIQKVVIDDEGRSIEVVVADDNLSLAIGKRGQNVRLASQLTGWKLDIVSESEMTKKIQRSKAYLMTLPGVTETLAMSLYQSGFNNIRDVAASDAAYFNDVPGFDESKGRTLIEAAILMVANGDLQEVKDDEQDIRDREAAREAAREAKSAVASARNAPAASDSSVSDSIESKLKAELEAQKSGTSNSTTENS